MRSAIDLWTAGGASWFALLKGSWDLVTRAIDKGNYTYNCL